ncbi:MAG: efflux RND transporter permease subunit, partial [Pirellulales bacterium]
MKLSDNAVDHPRSVLVLTVLLLILAGVAAREIPVQRTPAIHTAIVMVAVPYPGAQPTEVEDQITRRIEDALQRLDRVDFIVSTSMRGSGVIQVIFLDGVDSKRARDDVEHLVNEVRRQLPAGREVQPLINDIDFESLPILLVNLTGPPGFDERALKQIAEDAQRELEMVPGVANTQLFGGRERELHVNVHLDRLMHYGLSIGDVRNALFAAHAQLPGGNLDSGEFDLQVRNETRFRNVNDVRSVPIREQAGRMIYLADVADVRDTHQRLMNAALIDGAPCATIIVNKETDINTLGTAGLIKQKVAELETRFPHITFSNTRDASVEISSMFQTLGMDALFGSVVIFLVLSWSMGLRISMLVLMAIPFAMAVSLVFLYLAGFAISNMVIFAYIVASGMVIDGAIIVADAIYRQLEAGYPAAEAAKRGTNEVAVPVFAADLTTVSAFAPMLLVPGIMGDFLGVLPTVVCIALAGSLIVDHFLVPVVAAWWFRNYVPPAKRTGPEANKPDRVERLWAPFYAAYRRLLAWCLKNRWVAMAGCAASLGWAIGMLASGAIGFTFFPPSDRGQFEISFEMPLGTSIEETARAAELFRPALEKLKESGEVVHYVTALGSSAALSDRLDNDPAMGPEFGRIMIELTQPGTRARHESEIVEEVRKNAPHVPGMKFRINQIEEGPPGGADVAVRITGDDLEQIGAMSRRLVERLAQVEGTVEVRSDYRPDSPEYVVEPRPAVVGLFGMNEAEVARAIQTAVLGDTTLELPIDDEYVTLRLQAAPEHQKYGHELANIMVGSPAGRYATIGELADVRRTNGLFSVNRRDRNRAFTVSADVRGDLGVIPDDVFRPLRTEILPALGFQPVAGSNMAFLGQPGTAAEGLRAAFTGENEERDEGFFSLLRSMVVGIVLITAILVIEFNSFRQAAVVMMTVPLSFVGVVFGMWLCNFPFSLASFIGLISLTGVVVNDAIVLVDFA